MKRIVLSSLVVMACGSRPALVPEPILEPKGQLAAVVLPFAGPAGELAVLEKGSLRILEGVGAVNPAGPIGEAPLPPEVLPAVDHLLNANVIVGGRFAPRDGRTELVLDAFDPATGRVFASATLMLEAPPAGTAGAWSTAPAFAYLPVASLPKLHGAGLLARHVFEIGPEEGWAEVFKRTLGGAVGAITATTVARLPGFPTKERRDSDDPRDAPPPEIFGEEIEGQSCRVKLQCRWAVPVSRRLAGLGWFRNSYHCGWYTFIPSAEPKRIGFHLTGPWFADFGESRTGWVEAWTFTSDRGWEEFSLTFRFLEYDSQRDGHPDACEAARCLRRESWAYAAWGERPYEVMGQRLPNSNSFLGAVADRCGLTMPPLPQFPAEGQVPGWFYWRKVNRDFTRSQF